MPFGIQIKGFIIGALFALFVVPWVQSLLARHTRPTPAVA